LVEFSGKRRDVREKFVYEYAQSIRGHARA
jgi:hypothetical protein